MYHRMTSSGSASVINDNTFLTYPESSKKVDVTSFRGDVIHLKKKSIIRRLIKDKDAKKRSANLRNAFQYNFMQQTISRVLSWMVIYLGRMSPHASSRLFGSRRTSLTSHSGVAPGGVYSVRMSPYKRVSSYLAFPPLPADAGGIFLLHFP